MDRIIAVYKPKGPTSHDVIDEIRRITGERRVGHAGTLDPLARGVLVVGIGRDATKKLSEAVKKEKEYIAKIVFGGESTTDDAEGEKHECPPEKIPSRMDIENALFAFRGIIHQTPPIFSALKIKGKTAYRRARGGEDVVLGPREVEVKEIEVVAYVWPALTLRVVTGPGVYIRAIARDLGRALGTGGYLSDLERTRVGDFTKENAYLIADLEKILFSENS